jgi:hypothetical protein
MGALSDLRRSAGTSGSPNIPGRKTELEKLRDRNKGTSPAADAALAEQTPRQSAGVLTETDQGFMFLPDEVLGTSLKLTPRSLSAIKGQKTEIARNTIKLQAAGLMPEYTEYKNDHKGAFATLTKPLFDVATIGNRGQIGAAISILETEGDAYKALMQGGSEILDALPFIEVDKAMGPFPKAKGDYADSYADVFLTWDRLTKGEAGKIRIPIMPEWAPDATKPPWDKIAKDWGPQDNFVEIDFISSDGLGAWTTLGVGLLMDIFLDPVTYTGYGAIPTGLAKIGKAGHRALKLSGAVDTKAYSMIVNQLDYLAAQIRPGHMLKRQEAKLKSGDETLPELAEGGKEAINIYRNALVQAENMLYGKQLDARETATRLFAYLTAEQDILLGLTLNQSDDFIKARFKAAANMRLVPEGSLDDIMKGVGEFREEMQHFLVEGQKLGFLDPHIARENYAYMVMPHTENSKSIMHRLFVDSGKVPNPTREQGAFPGAVGASLDQTRKLKFAMPRQFKSPEHRFQHGWPTEVYASQAYQMRSSQQARAVTTKWLFDTVLHDPRVSKRVMGEPLDPTAMQAFRNKGYDIFETKLSHHDGSVEKTQWLLPQSIAKTLEETRRLYLDPDKMSGLMQFSSYFTNAWKGWAVFSPGFHARNNWTELSTSFLAGIGKPSTKHKWAQNLPAWSIRAAQTLTGSKDAQFPNMLAIYGVAARLAAGGSMARLGEGFTKNVLKMVGAETPSQLDELFTLPAPIWSSLAGVRMTDHQLIEEAASVGVLGRGWLGADATEIQRDQFIKTVSQPKRPIDKSPYTIDMTDAKSEADRTFEYSIGGDTVGKVRIKDGLISEVEISPKAPPGAHEQIIADAALKGGDAIHPGTGGITVAELEEMGFRNTTSAKAPGFFDLESGSRSATADAAGGADDIKDLLGRSRKVLERARAVKESPADPKDLFVLRRSEDGELNRFTRNALELAKGRTTWDQMKQFFGPNNSMTAANRAIGGVIEDTHRMAHYLDRRMRGMDKFAAAQDVRTWRFDYGELTPFERKWMTQIWPFYTWWRKNSVLQIQAMVNNPGRYNQIPKMMNAIESMSPEWENLPTPDYYDELNAVRLPWSIDDRVQYATLDLGYQDLNRFTAQDIFSSMGPLPKLTGEMIFAPSEGYNLFLQSARERYRGEEGQLGPLGLGVKSEAILRSILPPLDKTLRALKSTRSDAELINRLLAEGFGLTMRSLDIPREMRSRTAKERNMMRAFNLKKKQDIENQNRSAWDRLRGIK